MNTAAAIYENLVTTMSRESGSRGKAASEAFGDNSQQRFSDVLPLAQAAQEQAPEAETPEETTGQAPATVTEDTVDPGTEEEAPDQDEDEVAYSQVAGWPFGELVPPVVQSQVQGTAGPVLTGEQTSDSAAWADSSVVGVEQPSSQTLSPLNATGMVSTVGQTVQTEGMQQTQVVPTEEQLGDDSVATNTVTNVTISDGPDVALVGTAMDEEAPAVPLTPQKTMTGSAGESTEAQSGKAPVGQNDVRSEWTQDASGSKTSSPASRHGGQDARMSAVGGSDPQSQEQIPEAGQAPAKAQPASSQASAESVVSPKSQTNPREPQLATAGQDDAMSESADAVATEGPRMSLEPLEGKDVPAASLKDTGVEGTTTPELRVPAAGETTVSSQRVGSQTQSQTAVQTASPQTPAQSIGEQILDSVRASMANGERQVSIRLTPPELGMVVVRFQEQGEQLHGIVEVSNADTRREVERALPQVVRSLQEAGVQVRRVEVVTADQPDNRNMEGENLPQDVWQQHQGTGQSREHAYASQQTRWSQNLGGQSAVRQAASGERQQAAVTPGRIDLLL